jgi:hypothetical protein
MEMLKVGNPRDGRDSTVASVCGAQKGDVNARLLELRFGLPIPPSVSNDIRRLAEQPGGPPTFQPAKRKQLAAQILPIGEIRPLEVWRDAEHWLDAGSLLQHTAEVPDIMFAARPFVAG